MSAADHFVSDLKDWAFTLWAFVLLLSPPLLAQDLPVGTILEARLSIATGSRISHPGDQIEGQIIAPAGVGRIVVPDGSVLSGVIENVTRIGLGLKHRTASIRYNFEALRLGNGETVLIKCQVVEVETAKERVNVTGSVQGIHPIASLSSALDLFVVPLLFVTPPVGAPVWAAKSLIAPPADPEIYFPAGTEIIVRLTAPVKIPGADPQPLHHLAPLAPNEIAEVQDALKSSAQTARQGSHPSNRVNLLFLGSRQQMDRAFQAAGWSLADRKSPMSLYRMYYALTVRVGYRRAPMDTLTLNGVPSDFEYQKNLDTVQKRHHVRLWKEPQSANTWIGTAAEDVAFRFEVTHWTHSSDPRIDNERAKVVDDLAFTGCIDRAELLTPSSLLIRQGPKVPRVVTDGTIAVLRLNDCSNPTTMVGLENALPTHAAGRLSPALISFRKSVLGSPRILFNTYNALKCVGWDRTSMRATQSANTSAPQRGLDWLSSVAPTDLSKP